MSEAKGEEITNENWNKIWEKSAAKSIEHIQPQSSNRKYIHYLGNLTLLPPGVNSKLGKKAPTSKFRDYGLTGLRINEEIVSEAKWGKNQVIKREDRILDWAKSRWGD